MVHELTQRLARRGHSVLVFTTDANDERSRVPVEQKHGNGVEIIYFRNISNRLAYKFKWFMSPGIIRETSRRLGEIDLIHLHDLRTFQNAVVYSFAKNRIPYLVQAHGVLSREGRFSSLKVLYDGFFGKGILRNASRLIALNGCEADAYEQMGVPGWKVTTIPNGIDLANHNGAAAGRFRRQFELGTAPLVLYLGRIHESKGLDLLLDAFAELMVEIPEARLVLAGKDDGYLSEVRRRISRLGIGRRVTFTGFLSGREKYFAYADADVFATPRFLGFPLTFLEAMASGLPIVTTDAGDHLDIIDGEVGFVTKPDVSQFADALRTLLSNKPLRQDFGERARVLAKDYDWDLITSRLEQAYVQACGGHS